MLATLLPTLVCLWSSPRLDAQERGGGCGWSLRIGAGVTTSEVPGLVGTYRFGPGPGGGIAWLCGEVGRDFIGLDFEVQTLDRIGVVPLLVSIGRSFEPDPRGEGSWVALRIGLGPMFSTGLGGFAIPLPIGRDFADLDGLTFAVGGTVRLVWPLGGGGIAFVIDTGGRLGFLRTERYRSEDRRLEFAGFDSIWWIPLTAGIQF